MNWKFPSNFIKGSQEQPASRHQDVSTLSWYPPSVGDSTSRPSTSNSSSGIGLHQRVTDLPQSTSHGQTSPAEEAEVIARLKDKSANELRKLLTDKESYNNFFHSLDQVKIPNDLQVELRKETLQLARENLDKENQILELRNQCMIIRTTEVAAAQEKLGELERQKDEMLKSSSPISLLQKLYDALVKVEEESELLHRQLLDKDVDLATFLQKYKKLRTIYHRRALVHLSARTNS